jgi:hypothetical protein
VGSGNSGAQIPEILARSAADCLASDSKLYGKSFDVKEKDFATLPTMAIDRRSYYRNGFK